MTEMIEPQVKGMAIINARDWLDERLGAGWFTGQARTKDLEWPERVLPGDWYSVRTELHVFKRAHEQLDGFDSLEQLMATISKEVALNDLTGILRAFLWVASPRMFLRTAPMIWSTYANFTTIGDMNNDAGHFNVKVSDIPADIVTWVAAAWHGFLPPALELAGGQDPVSSIEDRQQSAGAETWEFVYHLRYE